MTGVRAGSGGTGIRKGSQGSGVAGGGGPIALIGATAITTGASITLPTVAGGYLAGDVAILGRQGTGNTNAPTVTGSGASPTTTLVNASYGAVHVFKLAPGDTAISWAAGAGVISALVVYRNCDPTTPVSSNTGTGTNGTAGLAQTAARDGSLNVQFGFIGVSPAVTISGGGFAQDLSVANTRRYTVGSRLVDIADGALGAAATFSDTMGRVACILQPPA